MDDAREFEQLARGVTGDQERWAEAFMVQRLHGAGAQAHVAERIGALVLAGDVTGVERWREIAMCLDQLLRATART